MIKAEELTNPQSCLNRAQDDELVFVLLARDAAAPHAIREWAEKRVRLGKNKWDDPQIIEALDLAKKMGEVSNRQAVLSEFRRTLHQLWGDWQEGVTYNGKIKEEFGRLDALGRKLEELGRKCEK